MYLTIGDYSMRPLAEGDLRTVLDWRNAPEVHGMMLTDHAITWEEHSRWFAGIRGSRPCRAFVFTRRGAPAGYFGYNAYDAAARACDPGAYLAPGMALPREAGIVLFYMAVEYAFAPEGLGMRRMQTEVFADNRSAFRLDMLLGYRATGKTAVYRKDGRGRKAVEFFITPEMWQAAKGMFGFECAWTEEAAWAAR